MNKFLSFLLLFGALLNCIHGQGIDELNCERTSTSWKMRYSQMQHYIPEAHDAVVTIHCNLIIWQNDEGTTNFQDTPEHRERLYNFFHHPTLGLNFQFYQRYSPPTDPIIPPEEEVHYKNVRFQLEGIYFIRNTQLSKSIGIADKRRYLQTNGYEDLLDEVNINITTAPGPVPGAWGHAQYPSYGDQVPMITTTDNPNQKSYAGQPSKEDAGYPVSRATFDGKEYYRDWSFMEHIAHELGHCLDLKHVYAGKVGMGYEACRIRDPEYMPDIFPANAPWCDNPRSGCDVCLQYSDDTPADARPDDGHTNNLMNGRGGRYLSPLQLGKIHRALALKSIGRAASGYSNRPVVIDSDETWDFPLQLYRPVRITKGATLRVSCTLRMPPEGYIKIDKGGELVIDGGQVISSNNDDPANWRGLKSLFRKNQKQRLRLINDGEIALPSGN